MNEDELVSLKGEIIQMSSRFWDGWGFGKLKPIGEGGKEDIRITGSLEGFTVGMHVSLTGKWKTSDKYGAQVEVETIVSDEPTDMKGIKQWIIDRLPQIGPVRAEALARKFGAEIWKVIETNHYMLTEVPGITVARAEEIAKSYEVFKKESAELVPFYDLGMTRREAMALKKEKIEPETVMGDLFYLYLALPHVFSFARTSLLAGRAGTEKTSPCRITAVAVESVRAAAHDGHTACTQDYVEEHAAALGNLPWSTAEEGLRLALNEKYLTVSETTGLIMLPKLATAETRIAAKIHSLLTPIEQAYGQSDRAALGSDGGGTGDRSRPDAGAGRPDDVDGEGGDHHGGSGNG